MVLKVFIHKQNLQSKLIDTVKGLALKQKVQTSISKLENFGSLLTGYI